MWTLPGLPEYPYIMVAHSSRRGREERGGGGRRENKTEGRQKERENQVKAISFL